jgi:hypothetical protein
MCIIWQVEVIGQFWPTNFLEHHRGVSLMATSVTEGGTQTLPKIFKIVKTFRHVHSFESSCGAISDGTLVF